ncbi:MAG: RNA polymerase sigma factor [Planctomycetota bacterium]
MAELLEDLLARCAAGDHAAVAVLVRRFRRYAMDLAVHILEDRHLAEDAVQEAFLTALVRLENLRTPAAFPGWLRQIVRTHAMRARRRLDSSNRPIGKAVEHQPSPAHAAEAEELVRLVRRALVSLPDRLRETAELFYLNEFDHYRVADVLDIPSGTVKRRLHDARRRLRDELAAYVEDDDLRPKPGCSSGDRLPL